MTLPIRQGRGGGMEEPAPRRKHPERQPGESYPDALTRVAGERDAALRDVARLEALLADKIAGASRELGLYDTTDGPGEQT